MTIVPSMVVFLFTNSVVNYVPLSNSADINGGLPSSTCDGQTLVGGYNNFGEKTSISHTYNLPPHTKIKVEFTLFYVDSWDGDDDHGNKLFFQVDGVTVKTATKLADEGSMICGSSMWYDKIGPFSWEGYHSSTTLKITLYDNFDEAKDNESWGFNNFKIYYDELCIYLYSECNYTGTKYSYCQYNVPEDQKNFPAQIKSFKIPSGRQLQLLDTNYQGGTLVTFSTNQSCVSGYVFPRKLFVP